MAASQRKGVMKDLVVNGVRAMVTDEVADALLDYAVALSQRGSVAVADFPALVEGAAVETQILVGAGLPLMAVRAEFALPADVPGTDEVAARFGQRARTLRQLYDDESD
jgi:hypothetical protein